MRHAVGDAVDRVVRLVLQALEHVLVVRDQVEVHGRDVAGGDQAQAGVAGRRDPVVLAGPHQGHHLVRRVAGLDVDLAAGLLLEVRHPVDLRIRGPVLDVAGPGDQVDLTLAFAERLHHALGRAAGRLPGRRARAACLVVVAAAAGGHDAQYAGRQQRRRPASDFLLAHSSSPPFDVVSIVNAFSGSQLARIRVPCRSNTSLEPRSRFWLTAISSPPASSATW